MTELRDMYFHSTMTELRDQYLKWLHGDDERVDKSRQYLTTLCARAANQIDSHIQGKKTNFDYVHELADVLGRHILHSEKDFTYLFPYLEIMDGIEKTPGKGRKGEFSEVGLEMKLLQMELRDVEHSKDPKMLRKTIVDIGKEILYSRDESYRRDLAA